MEPEDFEDYLQETEREIIEKMVREKEKEFTSGCNEGYKLLREHGVKCIDLVESESAIEALNRMLGYFIQVEHYEKCEVIKSVYVKAFKKSPEPIFPNFTISLDNE